MGELLTELRDEGLVEAQRVVEDAVGSTLVTVLDRDVKASELRADLAQQLDIPQAYALEDKAGGLLDL